MSVNNTKGSNQSGMLDKLVEQIMGSQDQMTQETGKIAGSLQSATVDQANQGAPSKKPDNKDEAKKTEQESGAPSVPPGANAIGTQMSHVTDFLMRGSQQGAQK